MSYDLLQDQGKEMRTASDATILVETYLATVGTTRPISLPVLQRKFVPCPYHKIPEARNTPARAFVVSVLLYVIAACNRREGQPCLRSSKASRDQIVGDC